MSSLKEIKSRINSVKSTQKITSAMKMVSSAKLRKAQSNMERFIPYKQRLEGILNRFAESCLEGLNSPLMERRRHCRVAIVAISSNSSLCGVFNSNTIKSMLETIRRYQDAGCEIDVYPVGKKVEDAVRKLDVNLNVAGSFVSLIDKPNYTDAKTFADNIINEFNEHRIDHVEIIYNHFKNAAVQIPVKEDFLPFTIQKHEKTTTTDYLIEPDKYAVLNELLPKLLRMKIYAALLDSATAEQAARMMAMQIATDNAEDILTDLNVQFNKQRQQSITSELLDIVGGSEALK